MKDIKTKEAVRDIRVIDRQAVLRGGLRNGYARTRDFIRKQSKGREGSENEDRDDTLRSYGEEAQSAIRPVRRRHTDRDSGYYPEFAEGSEEDMDIGCDPADRRIRTRSSTGTDGNTYASRGDFGRKSASRGAEGKGIKAAASSGEKAQETAVFDTVSSRRSTLMVKNAAENIKETVKEAGDSILKGVRWVMEATEDLYVSLLAGGWVSVAVIAVICIIGLLAASPFGIFLSGDDSGTGRTMQSVIREINEEFLGRINEIKAGISYDDLQISGGMSLWPDVLSVYAVRTTTDPDSSLEVVTVTDEKAQLLRDIFWDMNSISYRTETYDEEITINTPEGEESAGEEVTETVSRTRLLISVSHKTALEMSLEYGFSQEQNTYLDEMLSDRFRSLWSSLMGGYSAGMGIIPSEATWIGLNGFIWPLPINGTISSGYVYRSDPFTGEQKFHGGLDIAAAEGTPIVAAESGVVTIANGSDLWGGGYGYYVKIDHLNGYETLYGHCSFICVTEGQSVRKGEVIAYVGSTGNSTGDHLHFETYLYGERHDPMGIYTRT